MTELGVSTPRTAKKAEGSGWVHDGHTLEPTLDAIRAFRRLPHECSHRRKDVLFELTDAISTAQTALFLRSLT